MRSGEVAIVKAGIPAGGHQAILSSLGDFGGLNQTMKGGKGHV